MIPLMVGDFVDNLFGGDGDDTLNGGDDWDNLHGEDGEDTINGGDGLDWIYGGDGDDTLNGDDGTDRLYGEDGEDTINGGDGLDWLFGGDGDDRLYGNDGDDLLFGDASDLSFLSNYVSEGNGGHGDDRLYGNDGNDVLLSGLWGNDRLVGGRDTDKFVLNLERIDGISLVIDFNLSQGDKISVDTARGNETTLDAFKVNANIRIEKEHYTAVSSTTNNSAKQDIVIYDTRDGDALMVLEDVVTDSNFELTIDNFLIW